MNLENCEYIVLQIKTLDETCKTDKEFREKVKQILKLAAIKPSDLRD